VLGLALDLGLRNLENERSLDGFMKLVWKKFGKEELPYTLSDLQNVLSEYAGSDFSENFFNAYIYNSGMPDYKSLLASVGIEFDEKYENRPELGAYIKQVDNKWVVSSNPRKGSSLYRAGLSKGDHIVSIDGKLTNNDLSTSGLLSAYISGESVKVVFNRYGRQKEVEMTFSKDQSFKTVLMPDPSGEALKKQHLWLRTSR
jgi:predicted metalloprotease with PDZ domain